MKASDTYFRTVDVLILISFVQLFLLVTCTCSGQGTLVGKWNCIGIQPVNSDPWSKNLIELMIGKNSFKQFYPNNLYTSYENNAATYGRWSVTDNNSKLVTISYDGEVRTFEIIKITSDTLIILGKKKTYGAVRQIKYVRSGL